MTSENTKKEEKNKNDIDIFDRGIYNITIYEPDHTIHDYLFSPDGGDPIRETVL